MKNKKYAPMCLISIYILFTVAISFWGPRKYYNYNIGAVLVYILLFLVCLWCGYLMRGRVKLSLLKPHKVIYGKRKNLKKIMIISLHVALMVIVLELLCLIIQYDLSLSLSEMGNNYIKIRQQLDESGYNIGILLRFMTGIFRNISLTLGFFCFGELKIKYKIEFGIYILLVVLVNVVGYGTQKILGDIFCFFLVACFVRMLSWNRVKRIKVILLCAMFACVIVLVFAVMQNQRYAEIGVTAQNYAERSDGSTYYDLDNIIFKIFGAGIGFGIGSVFAYLSGGYFGLSLTFQLPFEWTYGLGSSYFISLLVERIFGVSIYEKTYLGRLSEFGRNGLSSWNTIFPWLASDFTFVGTLLLFLVVGYFLAYVWYEVIYYCNPISLVMFGTLCIGFLYLPANNQLFHGIDTFIATFLTFCWWVWKHNIYNVVENYEDKKHKHF